MKPKFHLVRCLFLALGVSASFGLGPGADTWNINVDESQGASADIYFLVSVQMERLVSENCSMGHFN